MKTESQPLATSKANPKSADGSDMETYFGRLQKFTDICSPLSGSAHLLVCLTANFHRFWLFPLVLMSLLGLANCTLTSRPIALDRNIALDKDVECTAPQVIDGKLNTIGQAEFLGWKEEIREKVRRDRLEIVRDKYKNRTDHPLAEKSAPTPRSLGSGFVITLPKKKSLGKIVIHAPGLQTGRVDVETAPGIWKTAGIIENNINSPIVIKSYSRLRVKQVRLIVQKMESPQYTGVQEIELYGPDPNALSMAQRAISENPNAPVAHRELGLVYLESHRLSDAIASFSEAIRLQPDFLEAYIDLGISLRRNGQTQQALKTFRDVLQLKNTLSDGYLQLAITRENVGQPLEAIFALENAMKFDRENAEVSVMLERLDNRRMIPPEQHLIGLKPPAGFFVGLSEEKVIEKHGEPDRILSRSNLFGVTKRLAYGDPITAKSGDPTEVTFEGSEFILGEAGVLGFHKVYSGDITTVSRSSDYPMLVDELPELFRAIQCYAVNDQRVEEDIIKYHTIIQKAQIIWELDAERWVASVYTAYPVEIFRSRKLTNTYEPKLKDYRIIELWVTPRDVVLSIGLE